MFIFTAKLNKRKLVALILFLALALCAIILAVSLRGLRSGGEREPVVANTVRDSSDAARYLQALGWEVDPSPLEVKSIVIPRSFTGVYADYAALQKAQGYPLEEYGGKEAVRYSFRVNNYPTGESGIVADLVVCGQTVIGGDIQSTALDGFMTGLREIADAKTTASY